MQAYQTIRLPSHTITILELSIFAIQIIHDSSCLNQELEKNTHITYSSSKFQSHYPTVVTPTPHSLTNQQHTFSNRIIRFPLLSSHLSQPTSLYIKVNHPIKFQKENYHVTFNLHIPPSILLHHNYFPIQASTHCKSFVHCVSDKSTPLHFCLFTIHYSTRQYLTVAILATISLSTSITH